MTIDLTSITKLLEWVVGIGTALGVIWGWIVKPRRKFEGDMKGQMCELKDGLQAVQGMTDFLTGDRLAQAHAYWMRKKYCPPADKARLVEMHKVYNQRGLNHLYSGFEDDLLELPDEPPAEKGA